MTWDATGKTEEEVVVQRRKDFAWGWLGGLALGIAVITEGDVIPVAGYVLAIFATIITFLLFTQFKTNFSVFRATSAKPETEE